MRKRLLFGLLAVALTAASVFPTAKSDAARDSQTGRALTPRVVKRTTLPNYDIRLAGRGEFTDTDLSAAGAARLSAQGAGTAAQGASADAQARMTAVDNFRAKLGAESARNLRAEVNETGGMKNFFIDGAALSSPRFDTPDQIARGFLKGRPSLFSLSETAVNNLKLEKEDNDAGTTFLDYAQTHGGVKVFEGNVKVVVGRSGEVLNVREGFLLGGLKVSTRPTLSESEGIAKAFEYAGRPVMPYFAETRPRPSKSETATFANPLAPELEEVLSELNVVRVGERARLAWHVYAEVGPEEWYELLVDAHTGELLLRHNLYVFEAQGTVYTEAPDKGARTLVSFVGDTTINTAAGWMGTSTVTTGNNVEAYLDRDANNSPDTTSGNGLSNGHASAADQNFTFPFSTTVDPRTQQAAVVTNLFYYNNIMHDFSYRLGFTETARNFQVNNFGRGGLGNDSVRAEAQDGSGTNNANFATPPDGSRPRMQQYLFTSPNPDRDSSVDGDVVFHEYGHGISNRLIGNGSTALSGTQSGAMGEGWSDYWAATINGDGAVGEYSTGNPNGIRRAPYSVPAATVHDSYADVCAGGCQVHRDGEVWAATLWDLRTQLGAETTDRLVLNGMKFTPNRPSFLNARDGILQADQNLNGGANRCAIWTVFARHGMGVSAVGNDGTTHTAASDLPSDCGGGDPCASATISPTGAGFTASGGTGSVNVTANASCSWTAVSNASFITVTGGANGTGSAVVNYSVASNPLPSRIGTMTIAGRTFTVTQAGTTGGGTNIIVNPGFESGTTPWVVSGQITRSTGTFPHGGVAYMIINGVNSTSGTLYQTVTIPSGGASLNFWLNITTSEAAGASVFDRLFIEVRSTSGTLLATLATFSNQNSGTAGVYVLRGPYNLNSFAGQTVRIQFRGTNDITLPTSFRVDDVSVQ
ncbi:MAG TPA: M36 family metallopeptidase [Pyrinomonadaceae bacterium]|nr:M36 family metallopeptidase [Pyrinomonadaceae bacterium]